MDQHGEVGGGETVPQRGTTFIFPEGFVREGKTEGLGAHGLSRISKIGCAPSAQKSARFAPK